MQDYIQAMNDIYLCAIENGAIESVAFNSLGAEVINMNGYFGEIDLWWHPGLNISLSLLPLAGIFVAYSYFIIGLTLLTYWGN